MWARRRLVGISLAGEVSSISYVIVVKGSCPLFTCEIDMSKTGLPASGKDVRCICGRMTARLEPVGLVIKCNRCGKLIVMSLSKIKGLNKVLDSP